MESENFPRGGNQSSSAKTSVKRKAGETDEPDLFKSSEAALKKKKQKLTSKEKRTKRKVDERKKVKSKEQFAHQAVHIHTLSPKTVAVGQLLLGVVKEVHELSVVVSVAGGLLGAIPITAVCPAYTELLTRLAEGSAEPEEVGELSARFRVGQTVRCKVTAVSGGGKKQHRLSLTVSPAELNSGLTPTTLKSGMVLPGCVASVEDHGCVLDIGVPGVTAFLSSTEADAYSADHNDGRPLVVGSYLSVLLAADDKMAAMVGENRVVAVSIAPGNVARATVSPAMGVTMHSLTPGMVVNATITKVSADGLHVRFVSLKGCLHPTHLPKAPAKYSEKEEVRCVVLSVAPLTKQVLLSALPHLLTPHLSPRDRFHGLTRGDTVTDSEVFRIDKKRGVYVKLPDNVLGIVYVSHLSDSASAHLDLSKAYRHGTVLPRLRVLDLDYADNVVILTAKPSIVSAPFLRYSDLTPGTMLEVTIDKVVSKRGISVTATNQISGYIPAIHTADVPLTHPEKRYTEGERVKAKVLSVDPERKRLILTLKKSLLNPKAPLVASYSDLPVGTSAEGFVCKVMDRGVVVGFFNNIKGFVPKSELSTEDIVFPQKVFYPGQMVRCSVIASEPDTERLILSLKIAGKPGFGSKPVELPGDFSIGKSVDVRIGKKTSDGFDVTLLPSQLPAFLPRVHLSDHATLCDLLHDLLRPGNVLKGLVYIGSKNVIAVTNKKSLKDAGESLNRSLTDLKVGQVVPGVVKKVLPFGAFIDLGAGLTGLAPNRNLPLLPAGDGATPDFTQVLREGQSVVAAVTNVDLTKQRFLLSLRPADCFPGNPPPVSMATDLVTDFLKGYSTVLEGMGARQHKGKPSSTAALSGLRIGQTVDVTIQNIDDAGCCLVTTKDGVTGTVAREHTAGAVVRVGGRPQKAVILYIDPRGPGKLTLSLKPALTTAAASLNPKNKHTQAVALQRLGSVVEHIMEDGVIVSLTGHAVGRLAVLPTKKHLNDVTERLQFAMGQENPVVIKRVLENGLIIAGLVSNETEEAAKKTQKGGATKEKAAKTSVPVTIAGAPEGVVKGSVVEAKVTCVRSTKLFVDVCGVPGRIHMAEVTADVTKQGEKPLEKFKVGQEVRVKVLGKERRMMKVKRKLSGGRRILLSCTALPSKVSAAGVLEEKATRLTVGNTYTVFVSGVGADSVSVCLADGQSGVIPALHTSYNIKEVQKLNEKFSEGQAYSAVLLENVDGEHSFSLLHDVSSRLSTPGAHVIGRVTRVDLHSGLTVSLPHGRRGCIPLTHITDSFHDDPTRAFQHGHLVHAAVVSGNDTDKTGSVVTLSLRKSRLNKDVKKIKDREISAYTDLKRGSVVRGYLTEIGDTLKVCLGDGVLGTINYHNTSVATSAEQAQQWFSPGRVVAAKVLTVKSHSAQLSMLKAETGVDELQAFPKEREDTAAPSPQHKGSNKLKRKSTETEEPTKSKKVKASSAEAGEAVPKSAKKEKKHKNKSLEDRDSGVDVKDSDSDEVEQLPSVKSTEGSVPRLSLDGAAFSWDAAALKAVVSTAARVDSDSDGNDSSDADEVEADNKTKQKSRKQTRSERLAAAADEERSLFALERRRVEAGDAGAMAESAADFDRLVLTSPDSSMVWLRYMAHHLETSEIEKARAVAERALKTISFREEAEKLNVWAALISLEQQFGSADSLASVVERALQHNDQKQVYSRLVQVYIAAGQEEPAEQTYNTMMRKFKQDKDILIDFGLFYFKHGKVEMARKLLKALQAPDRLQRKDHTEIVSKFAQMEFKYGESERGKTMFESLMSSYPRRTDLWSVYIDMLTKHGLTDDARLVYERVIHLPLAAKKMKFFFKKYLDFEQKYGTDQSVQAVKQKAVEYVEAKSTAS